MSDIKELTDEELKQISGDGYYGNNHDKWFNTNAIAEDSLGLRYKILCLNCIKKINGKNAIGLMHLKSFKWGSHMWEIC